MMRLYRRIALLHNPRWPVDARLRVEAVLGIKAVLRIEAPMH